MFKQRFVPSGEAFRPHMMDKSNKLFISKWNRDIVNGALKSDNEFEKLDIEADELELEYNHAKYMIERFFKNFCDNVQDGIKIGKFQNSTQGYYFTRPVQKEAWLDDEFIINFTDKFKIEYQKKEDKIPFVTTLHVGGYVDSIQKNFDNDIILVDYKTSNKYKNSISEEYILQLSIYAYLFEKQTGKLPAYVAINYLRFNESFYIMVTPDMVKLATTKIKEMRSFIVTAGIDIDNYPTKPSKLCDWCSFKDKCMGLKDE